MSFERAFYYNMGYWEASGDGWVLYQYLPYLSDVENTEGAGNKNADSWHIITDLSYNGTTLTFSSARMSELVALQFTNTYGDTETNDTGALKAVRVPFHNGCYDLYRPTLTPVTGYTNAYISNNTLYTTKETVNFYLKTRSWNTSRGKSNFTEVTADVDDPNYAAYPDSSAFFEPYWVDNSYYAPLFGAVNCDGLSYGTWVTPHYTGWRITGFPTSDHYVPASSRLRYNDFAMYGNVFAMAYSTYVTAAYIKSTLEYSSSSTVFACYNKLEYE